MSSEGENNNQDAATAGASIAAGADTTSQDTTATGASTDPATDPAAGGSAVNDTQEAASGSQAASQPAATDAPAPAAAAADAPAASASTPDTLLGFSIPQIVTFVGMVAGAVIPGASLAGFTISQLTNLAVGVANEVPEAVNAFEEIKTVATSGLPPTPAQWATWNAAADMAHNALQAAATAAEETATS